MKEIATLFDRNYLTTTKTTKTERGELLIYFMNVMNPLRKSAGYKEWDIKRTGYMLSVYNTHDLYCLKTKCEQSKNFGSTFNYFIFCSENK